MCNKQLSVCSFEFVGQDKPMCFRPNPVHRCVYDNCMYHMMNKIKVLSNHSLRSWLIVPFTWTNHILCYTKCFGSLPGPAVQITVIVAWHNPSSFLQTFSLFLKHVKDQVLIL